MFSKAMALKGAIAAGLAEAGNVDIVTDVKPGSFLIMTHEGENVPVKGVQSVVAGTVNYTVKKG